MALVSRGFLLTVTLIDNGANSTSVSYQLRASTYANASTAVSTILSAINNASSGTVASYRLTETFEEDALVVPSSASFQAEVSASMTALIAGEGNKKASYRIPIPKAAIFVAPFGAGANVVDTTNVSVVTYHQLFTDTGVAYVSDGEIAGSLLGGVRVTRAKRGG